MRFGPIFVLTLVVFSLTAGCSPKRYRATVQQKTFVEHAENVVLGGGEELGTEVSTDSGVLGCGGRLTTQDVAVLAALPRVEAVVRDPGQKVIVRACQRQAETIVELAPVSLNLKEILQTAQPGDQLILRNRTTCTERTVLAGPFGEIAQVFVLPVGQEVMDAPNDLSVDPTRLNIVDIEISTCSAWAVEGDKKVCETPVPVFAKRITVKVILPAQMHKNVRTDVEENCPNTLEAPVPESPAPDAKSLKDPEPEK